MPRAKLGLGLGVSHCGPGSLPTTWRLPWGHRGRHQCALLVRNRATQEPAKPGSQTHSKCSRAPLEQTPAREGGHEKSVAHSPTSPGPRQVGRGSRVGCEHGVQPGGEAEPKAWRSYSVSSTAWSETSVLFSNRSHLS